MCGLIGISSKHKPITEKKFLLMRDSIDYRGPDDSGTFNTADQLIRLGHRRLSIIDLQKKSNQPFEDESGVLSFNGEIYNYQSLRENLAKEGCKFLGNSDTEVLLNLYLSEGKAMLSKLNGIFAFAIWDINDDSIF